MPVSAIQSCEYESNYGNFSNVAAGTVAGGLLGYAAKYALPLTIEEHRDASAANVELHALNRALSETRSDLNKSLFKTLEHDIFEKIEKKGAVDVKDIEDVFKALPEGQKKELHIVKNKINDSYLKWLEKYSHFEKWNLKKIRPAVQFIAAGAAIGFIAAFARNVFKTDVNCNA
jgi:hypothetical protein